MLQHDRLALAGTIDAASSVGGAYDPERMHEKPCITDGVLALAGTSDAGSSVAGAYDPVEAAPDELVAIRMIWPRFEDAYVLNPHSPSGRCAKGLLLEP